MSDRNVERKSIDPSLIVAVQNQDPQATEVLYTELRGRTQRYFLRMSSDKALAEDLADIATTTILTKIGKYSPRPGMRFENWAGVVARNKWRDYLRHIDAKRRAEERYQQRMRIEAASPSSNEEERLQAQRRELSKYLADPRSKVTAGQRRVLELRIDGIQFSEIAELMGKNITAVKKLAERGKRRVRKNIHRESISEGLEPQKPISRKIRIKRLEPTVALLNDRGFREWLLLTQLATCDRPQLLQTSSNTEDVDELNGKTLKKAGWKTKLSFNELATLSAIPQHADVVGISIKDLAEGLGKTKAAIKMSISRLETKLPPYVALEREYLAGVMYITRIVDPEKIPDI